MKVRVCTVQAHSTNVYGTCAVCHVLFSAGDMAKRSSSGVSHSSVSTETCQIITGILNYSESDGRGQNGTSKTCIKKIDLVVGV